MAILELLPSHAAAEVARRFDFSTAELSVYWVAVASNRKAYARELRLALNEHPVAVSVLRRSGVFENPNGVMSDLIAVIEDAKGDLDACFERYNGSGRWAVVIVARGEFPIGQSSSPVELPEWFPAFGGAEVYCSIEDITWTTRVSLGDRSLLIDDLHRRVYDIERALLRRLRAVNKRSAASQDDLFRMVHKAGEQNFHAALAQADRELLSVSSPSSYRPSAKRDAAFVARLWDASQRINARQAYALSNSLATALQLKSTVIVQASVPDNLFADMNRPFANYAPEAGQRFCYNLLWALTTSLRIITMAHHADDFGAFPVPLLFSVIQELRETLAAYEQVLNLHET